MRDQAGCVEHYAAVSNGGSFDLAQHNNTHQFVVADGVGKGLGRIKNVRRSWRKMKAKLSDPLVDTSVTFAQYEALDRDGRLEKKRVPGSWTPSRYKSNRRAIADLREKTLIVYDLDYITHDQLDEIRMGLAPISKYAWFMHTSRSHCPESPRARMILPISRPMKPDEAHAAFRILAQELADDPEEGIEIPDLVSFRGNQTMFWPSRSRDQEFWTDENVGEIVDVDAVLSSYPGWEDYTNLPYQGEENSRGITDPNKRMEDPHKKQEPIGAWCRSYTVQEVIENWLTDIYAPGDSETEERYTYLLGTGSNGAVVYEDGKFLHSNHGSDPVETANAFDLCRIHMFGHLDEGKHGNTTPGNLPSFKAMRKFAMKDRRVIAEMNSHMDDLLDDLQDEDDEDDEVEDQRQGVDDLGGVDAGELRDIGDGPNEKGKKDDDLGDLLGDLPEEGSVADNDTPEKKHAWRADLKRKANGELQPTLNNVVLILENDPRFKARIGFNEFSDEIAGLKPIRSPGVSTGSKPLSRAEKKYGRLWLDADDIAIRYILSLNEERKGYDCEVPINTIEQAVSVVSGSNTFNPLKSMFEAARDKYVAGGRASKGSIETVFIRYLGVPDNVYTRQASRNFMLALVARTFEPGCKFDNVVVIQGKQGGGKSTFWRIMSRDFFVELPQEFDDTKKMVESMSEALIAEMGEMAGLRKETAEKAKEFIARQVDKTRLSYDRRPKKFPRKTVLVGTSNLDKILHDPTGNRRFWVMQDNHDESNPIDIYGLKAELNALQGEACDEYFKMREKQPTGELHLDLDNDEARAIRDQLGEQFRERHVWEKLADLIEDWLNDPQTAEEALGASVVDSEFDDGELVVPNRFTRADVMDALARHPEVKAYRNLNSSGYDSALQALVDRGVVEKPRGKYKVDGVRRAWFVRGGGETRGPLYIRADEVPEPLDDGSSDHDIDDMLG